MTTTDEMITDDENKFMIDVKNKIMDVLEKFPYLGTIQFIEKKHHLTFLGYNIKIVYVITIDDSIPYISISFRESFPPWLSAHITNEFNKQMPADIWIDFGQIMDFDKIGDKKMEKKQITAINLNPETGFLILHNNSSGPIVDTKKNDVFINSHFIGVSEKELEGLKNGTYYITKKETKVEHKDIFEDYYKKMEKELFNLVKGCSVPSHKDSDDTRVRKYEIHDINFVEVNYIIDGKNWAFAVELSDEINEETAIDICIGEIVTRIIIIEFEKCNTSIENAEVKGDLKMETNLVIVYKNHEVATMHLSDGDSVVLDFENDVSVNGDTVKVVKYDFNKNSDNFVSTLVNIHRCCMGQKITMKHKGGYVGEFNWAKVHGSGDISIKFKCDDKILSVSGDIEI